MIKADGSMYVPSDWTGINPFNGRFLKGHQPHNKGRKIDEWMSKEGQRNSSKGWKNLDKYRNCNGRSDVSCRTKKEVVAVRNNGKHHIFDSIVAASDWLGGNRENIGRCCRCNQERHVNKKTGKINTDHQYKGVRFYYATDPIWMEKIGKEIV